MINEGKKKFSIILPVRNGSEYIKECVQSILAQTFTDFNLLVLDNKSTDGTLEWLQSITDKRVEIYASQSSLSIEKNWGRIKDIPKNEFMTMIGHDDLLHPGYLQEMNELINKHPTASLYQTHFDYIDANGRFVRDCLLMNEVQHAHEFLACQMKQAIDSTGTGYMMRSADFDALGGMPVQYPNLIFSDYQLWVSLIAKGYKATSPLKTFSYRLHASLSYQTNGMAYQEAFTIYVRFLLQLMKTNTSVKTSIQQYGKQFMLYYCEALSHRLLKTDSKQRSLTVSDFIKKCKTLAAEFIPGQHFLPMKKFRIWIAAVLDNSALGRELFQLYKKI